VSLRVAAASQSARIGLVVDGKVLVVLDLPVTGGWQIWETVSTEIYLKKGMQKLKVFAFIGGYNLNWMEFSYITGINEVFHKPAEFQLYPNYPNPFNSSTKISYELGIISNIVLTVYDMTGRVVRNLVSGVQPAGQHEVLFNANDLTSGIYFYSIKTSNGFRKCGKMILAK